MQQCNICSSNPNNKTYNYHTFEPDEYVKSARPSKGIIIEGLNAMTQSSSVTDSATSFSQSNADFKKCTINNETLCDDLNKQYKEKVSFVAELEPAYTEAETAYESCNNHKQTCIGIRRTIKSTQRSINWYDNRIEQKNEILQSCDPYKVYCDKLLQRIKDKEQQIADLKGYIASNEALQNEQKCKA